MIDPWLFAVLCLAFLSICAIVRVMGRTTDDQLIGITTAITIACGAGLALTISWGNLLVLDILIAFALLCYAGTFTYSRYRNGDTP